MAGKLKNYNSSFGVNKHPGIFFNNLANGDVVFYMRVTLEGKKANIKNRTKKAEQQAREIFRAYRDRAFAQRSSK